jgi:UDP-3-O-[3-hydroxymyristoyl] N-acetylglucosamine deacetylase
LQFNLQIHSEGLLKTFRKRACLITSNKAYHESKQVTLKTDQELQGVGLFSGAKTSVAFREAKENHGIVFQRVDLPNQPLIPASLTSVQEAVRCTQLVQGSANILMVEHLLSALSAYQIDNLLVQLKGPELPMGDGSASMYVDLIQKAKIIPQLVNRKVYSLKTPVSWSHNEIHLIAIPSDEYRISYTLHYPHSKFLRSQYLSFRVNPEEYAQEIASCRTFALYEEVAPMLKKGLLPGGGLENGVVIKDDHVLNPEGVRFFNEMVRHKILDLMGDLSLMGIKFKAHIIAIRSGHFSNVSFARVLKEQLIKETSESTTRP